MMARLPHGRLSRTAAWPKLTPLQLSLFLSQEFAQPRRSKFDEAAQLAWYQTLPRMDQVHWHRIRLEIHQDDAEQSLLDRLSNLIRQYVSDPDAGNRCLNGSIRFVDVQRPP